MISIFSVGESVSFYGYTGTIIEISISGNNTVQYNIRYTNEDNAIQSQWVFDFEVTSSSKKRTVFSMLMKDEDN